MKEILLVCIPVLFSAVIPAILTFITNIRVKNISDLRKDFEKQIERSKQEYIIRHQETLDRFADIEVIIDKNDIDAVRNRIVAFDNLCRLDKKYTNIREYQYKTYFKDEDKWKSYHKKYPELNGEIDLAIENIRNHYKKYKEQ